jgi:hypothetical protein
MIKLKDIILEGTFQKEPKLTKEDKEKMLSVISKYADFGPGLATKNLIEMVSEIKSIVESAKKTVLNEEDDWFNKRVLAEDMKTLDKNYADFEKIAKECMGYQQQMEALYENMGHILSRYFDVTTNSGHAATVDADLQKDVIAKENAD